MTEVQVDEESSPLDAFAATMTVPLAAEQAFFARRRRFGLGVGLDAKGNLVYAKDDTRHDPGLIPRTEPGPAFEAAACQT